MSAERQKLKDRVDEIIKVGTTGTRFTGVGDPEQAHIDEDKLHSELIEQFCPSWVKLEIYRLDAADFSRWYA